MFVLDTDTLSHLVRGNERVKTHRSQVTDDVVLTVITRIEVLQGRFATILKAEDGDSLEQAQHRLAESERQLARFDLLLIDGTVAAEFDRLRQNKKLKKIGRADLLIAAIALAHGATLITRNLKDFRLVPGLKLENWVD